ncbi:hypothetical protein MK489_07860 [Myxococcota bacterium]|nr:hypothetical protein [Myxococcota bacterium]
MSPTPSVESDECFARDDLDSREFGYGMHEHLVVGVYPPVGFDTMDAVAP